MPSAQHRPTRSQRARKTALASGLYQYGLLAWEVEEADAQIKKCQSRFVCHIGKLTVHRMMLGYQEVYCAYDSNISTIGFFLPQPLARRMHRNAEEKKSSLRLPSQAQ